MVRDKKHLDLLNKTIKYLGDKEYAIELPLDPLRPSIGYIDLTYWDSVHSILHILEVKPEIGDVGKTIRQMHKYISFFNNVTNLSKNRQNSIEKVMDMFFTKHGMSFGHIRDAGGKRTLCAMQGVKSYLVLNHTPENLSVINEQKYVFMGSNIDYLWLVNTEGGEVDEIVMQELESMKKK